MPRYPSRPFRINPLLRRQATEPGEGEVAKHRQPPAPPRQESPSPPPGLRQAVQQRHAALYGVAAGTAGDPRFAPRLPPDDSDDTEGNGDGRVRAGSSNPRLLSLAKPPFAVRVLNNLSYGATPLSIAEFNALGSSDPQRLANWVDWQLDWPAIDDSALVARLNGAGYNTLNRSLPQLWSGHRNSADGNLRGLPASEVQRAAFVRATHSRRQLHEVLVNFWHSHFNVHAPSDNIRSVFSHYDREIRAHSAGNFRSMLEAVAKHTAMLYFLDNYLNTRAGPNENFARELLELHTFGAENYLGFVSPFSVPPCPEDPTYPIGYTDIDVYETAAAFTGWSVNNDNTTGDGTFLYRQSFHDAGPKSLLGMLVMPEQPALKDGRDVLDRIASHPRVARFICRKLVRRFINDKPSEALVNNAAKVFRSHWQHPRQIEITLRHILNSDDLINSWGQKNRRPFEATVAAMRVLGQDWTVRVGHARSDDFMRRVGFTGHVPYNWGAPNGFPDVKPAWSGSNSFVMTWKLLNWMTEAKDGEVPLSPILALSRSAVASWTADNLVAFWCQRILGYQPDPARRQAIVAFMAQNGNPATSVINDTDTSSKNDLKQHYNHQRLRSMVSLILLSPEFLSR